MKSNLIFIQIINITMQPFVITYVENIPYSIGLKMTLDSLIRYV